MNMIMTKLHILSRIRQLHTIISQETIKPSSPTPPRLKIHKLSLIDYFAQHTHMPLIFFYQSYKNDDTNILKKSLSQCLTRYYPFAGSFVSPSAHHVECNDQGVEFLEASRDSRLDNFIHKKEQDKTLDQLIPNISLGNPTMMQVQLNHFTCGGIALTVSISHKIADGFTMLGLCNHWADLARGGSPLNPTFLNLPISNIKIPDYQLNIETSKLHYANRKFVFPNSKLNELKKTINAMGTTPVNPTRVESLTSLLFKCAVSAATTKTCSLHLQPSNLIQAVNLRNKVSKEFPILMEAGNFTAMVFAKMIDYSSQIELNQVIIGLRQGIMDVQGIRDVKELAKVLENSVLEFFNGRPSYMFTSVCRFPLYEVDFGWGKPVRVMLRGVNPGSYFMLMDTPDGDGIEALVQLEEDKMVIFQNDKELLAYAQDI
ncbi:17,18-epoxy-17-hydroxycur-19-ene N-malonyltransferase-like [Bidens hawaiensis]|uniref:17,18-epoxy-17-hydroxycur-19-ene N-malonyltransferase-like n=1 Tax=Bidens hawaiensis TaxID=980011 RepID=UPI004049C2E5